MDQRGNVLPVAVDERCRPPLRQLSKSQRSTVDVGICPVLGQPVRELERWITQCARKSVAEVGRSEIESQFEEELTQSRPGEPRLQEADQEDGRRKRQGDEGGPADLSYGGPIKNRRHEEKRDQHECQAKGIDDQRDRASKRLARTASAHSKDNDPGEATRAHGQELHLPGHILHAGIRVEVKQIVRSEVTGGHPNELERDRNDVRGRDEAPHESALQPPIRKCQKDVQEENRRHQVEHLPKGVQDVSARPDQRRKEVDESGHDQQRAETVRRSSPPRNETTHHVGERDPRGQRCYEERLTKRAADVFAQESEREGRGCSSHSEQDERPANRDRGRAAGSARVRNGRKT